MPRARTPSRGRAGAAKKSPARSRSRSRGRKSPARGARSPARVGKSPARASRASPPPPPPPARVTRSRSPARVAAPPAGVKPAAPRTVTPPPERASAVPVAATTSMLTSTPKSEVRARRPISRTALNSAAGPTPVTAEPPSATAAAAVAAAAAAAASPATRQSARIASKLKELGIDPAAGGDTLKEPTPDGDVPKKATNTVSWGRVLLTPLVLVLALVPLYLFSACNKKHCRIGRLPDPPRSLKSWLDPVSFLYVAGFLALQLLLALVPVGRVVEGQISKQGISRYRCNGFFSLFVTLAGTLLALYLGFPVLAKLRPLLVAAALTGLLLSFVLLVRARRAHLLDINPAGDTESVLVNLVAGRELSPRLLGIDLKLLLVRAACVSAAVLAVLMVLAERTGRGETSPTLLTAAGMVLAICVDRMWFEDNLLTTYSFMNDGLGLRLLLMVFMSPFFMVFNIRFTLATGVSQPWYALVGCVMLYMVGYLIQRSSNSQKNEFRKNPVNPALAHLETIPTTKGKKLLVSGWWGVVRHPNHLGDLLTFVAMSLPLGFQHGLAWVVPAFVIVVTALHVRLVDAHCQQKYGAAWERYVDRVRHRLVPAVY